MTNKFNTYAGGVEYCLNWRVVSIKTIKFIDLFLVSSEICEKLEIGRRKQFIIKATNCVSKIFIYYLIKRCKIDIKNKNEKYAIVQVIQFPT